MTVESIVGIVAGLGGLLFGTLALFRNSTKDVKEHTELISTLKEKVSQLEIKCKSSDEEKMKLVSKVVQLETKVDHQEKQHDKLGVEVAKKLSELNEKIDKLFYYFPLPKQDK